MRVLVSRNLRAGRFSLQVRELEFTSQEAVAEQKPKAVTPAMGSEVQQMTGATAAAETPHADGGVAARAMRPPQIATQQQQEEDSRVNFFWEAAASGQARSMHSVEAHSTATITTSSRS